jgi:hypothetical protein
MALLANVALTNTFDTWRLRTNALLTRVNAYTINESSLYANTLTANVSFLSKGNAVFAGSTSNTLVRITQTGSGNALLVEDASNPDSTPFVVTADGRVGVGTTVNTSSRLRVADTTDQIIVTTGTNELTVRASSTEAALYTFQSIPMVFYTNNAERMRIAGTGQITACTSLLASQNLTVSGNTTLGGSSKTLTIGGSGATANATGWFGVTGRATVSTNLFVGANTIVKGNLGVGTNSPSDALHVAGGTLLNGAVNVDNGTIGRIQFVNGVSIYGGIGTSDSFTADMSTDIAILAESGQGLRFYANSALNERMRITSAGRVGIGTTSPAATLDVSGTVSVAKANILNQTLTDGATINWNTASGQVATVTLGGNRTIAAPTNLKVGTYILHVIQDGTGSRTLTWNSVFKWTAGVAPPLTTTANARDVFSFVSDGTNLYGSFIPDVR